jgi:formylglycine-generating enzyme required for sulfatase activity
MLMEAPRGEGNYPRPASWYDAVAFCFWLTDQIGRRVFLPTMAQRRRAIQGSDNRTYPWGNKLNPAFANYRDNGPRRTTPVTEFGAAASPYGIMDLVGNTWEWLVDGHNLTNPYDYKAKADRMLSGGSYRSAAAELSSDYVMKQPPDLTAHTIGFRTIVIL